MKRKTIRKRVLAFVLTALTAFAGVQMLLPGITIAAQAADGYLWPVPSSGNISTSYSDGHTGIDITGQNGCDIVSAKAGTVYYVYTGCVNSGARASGGHSCETSCSPSSGNFYSYTRSNGTTFKACNWGYGNGVVIKHSDGSGYSMYAHMESVTVSKGAVVSQGQKIGTMGACGNATGTHLHFQLSADGSMSGTYFKPSGNIDNNVGTGIYISNVSPIIWDSVYVQNITETSALIRADVTADCTQLSAIGAYVNGVQAAEWPTQTYLHFCSVQLGGENAEAFESGLRPGTTYSYYFYVVTKSGNVICGETQSFTTPCTHAFDPGVVTQEASCTSTGIKTYTCSKCGATETEITDALGHDYRSTVVAPTDTTPGYTRYTCSRCGDTYTDVPNAGQFVVSASRGRAGQTTDVTVSVRNNPGIVATRIFIYYDSAVLTLNRVTDGGLLGDDAMLANADITSEPYCVIWEDTLSAANHTADGILLTLSFTIRENAPLGTTAVTLAYDAGSTFDKDLTDVPFAVVNGAVEIVDRKPGDANGDGVVDLMDAALIKRMLAGGFGVTVDEANADVNADGIVNLKDAALVRRYLAGGWDVTLL